MRVGEDVDCDVIPADKCLAAWKDYYATEKCLREHLPWSGLESVATGDM